METIKHEKQSACLNVLLLRLIYCICVREQTCSSGPSLLQGFRLLGILDVQNVPCARDAILHGAGGSLAAGLLHFLATSEFYLDSELCVCVFMAVVLVVMSSIKATVRVCFRSPQVVLGGLLMWDLQASC